MATQDAGPNGPKDKTDPIAIEQTKLTATYLNTAAGGVFTAGIAAPIVAAVFGLAGTGTSIGALALVFGVSIFLCASFALHAAARVVLKGLKP